MWQVLWQISSNLQFSVHDPPVKHNTPQKHDNHRAGTKEPGVFFYKHRNLMTTAQKQKSANQNKTQLWIIQSYSLKKIQSWMRHLDEWWEEIGLFWTFLHLHEHRGNAAELGGLCGSVTDMSVVRGIFLVSCYDGSTRRNLVFKTHISS